MFSINGYLWKIEYVSPHSKILVRDDGVATIGVTDFNTLTVSIADNLYGALLRKVIIHELSHCFVFSYGLKWGRAEEERLCDFVATYGNDIISIADELTADDWYMVYKS